MSLRRQPLKYWREKLSQATTYRTELFGRQLEAADDPQLRENDVIVPLEGAGEQVKFTVSSPLKVHGHSEVTARRAPDIGEHNEDVLKQLGLPLVKSTACAQVHYPARRHLETETAGGDR